MKHIFPTLVLAAVLLLVSISIFLFPVPLDLIICVGFTAGILFVLSGILSAERHPNELAQGLFPFLNRILYTFSLYSVLASIVCVYMFCIVHLLTSSQTSSLAITCSTVVFGGILLNVYVKWILDKTPTGISFALMVRSMRSISILAAFLAAGMFSGILISLFLDEGHSFFRSGPGWPRLVLLGALVYVVVNLILGARPDVRPKLRPGTSRENVPSDNILLLGLDSADWRVLTPLLKKNKLPTLKRLMQSGAYGYLDCYGKRYSPIVWTSIATGTSAAKHGIQGFLKNQEGNEDPETYKSYHRRIPAIWDIYSHFEKSVGIINWMVTYPAEKVNGLMISDFRALKEGQKKNVVHPSDREQDFFSILQKHQFYGQEEPAAQIEDKWAKDAETENRVLTALLDRFYPQQFPELAAIYAHSPDAIQHRFWQYREPDKFPAHIWKYDPLNIPKYLDFIDRHWIELDKFVEKSLEKTRGRTTVCIVSDHGSKPRNHPLMYLDLNLLLSKLGYLQYQEGSHEIDFQHTQAYWSSTVLWDNTMGVSFNLKGREQNGIVEPNELDQIRDQLIRDLVGVHPRKKLFVQFETKQSQGIDLIFKPTLKTKALNSQLELNIKGRSFPLRLFQKQVEGNSGNHAPRGICLLCGEDIRRSVVTAKTLHTGLTNLFTYILGYPGLHKLKFVFRQMQNLGVLDPYSSVDIFPTLLYLAGLPIPEHNEGRIMTGLIKQNRLRKYPPESLGEDMSFYQPEVPASDDFKDYDKGLKDQLKGLGYID